MLAIRASDEDNMTLAVRFGVTPGAICHCRSGLTYKNGGGLPAVRPVAQRKFLARETVRSIFLDLHSDKEIAVAHGINRSTVNDIKTRQSYGEYTEDLERPRRPRDRFTEPASPLAGPPQPESGRSPPARPAGSVRQDADETDSLPALG